MRSIEWCYFQWPLMTLATPKPLHFRHFLSPLMSSYWMEIEISNLVDGLIIASASSRMAIRPRKEHGQVMWTIKILVGTNHISGMADRLRCCQLRWTVSVVNWWWRSRSAVIHTDRRHLCTTWWAWVTASWQWFGLLHVVWKDTALKAIVDIIWY